LTATTAAASTVVTGPWATRDGELFCEDVALAQIAAEVGTPTYVYSRASIERAYRAFDDSLKHLPHLVCYSVKANPNLGVLSVLARLGAGADVVSIGELYRWQRAGGDLSKVVFSGVGKTASEMSAALDAGILMFNVESEAEIDTLDEVSATRRRVARIALRINPDVDAQTHPYISTGLRQNKFGISTGQIDPVLGTLRQRRNLVLVGIDCHIGSQLTRLEPLVDALAHVVQVVSSCREQGFDLRYLDIGGGLGVDYGKPGDPVAPTAADYGAAIEAALAPLASSAITVLCEPGRSIVATAGVLLTSVLRCKTTDDKHFTVVDAAMNDLMRPALYGSYHPIWPVNDSSAPTVRTDVVGPICETSDFLARERDLPVTRAGDLLAIGCAGAYGASMSSNYNTRPRAAEVLVSGNHFQVVRRRETLEQLIAGESVAE
jgi:diaminopimelate decarboxylase